MAVSLASLSSQLVCLVIILGAFSPTTNAVEIPSDYHSYPELEVAYKVHTERRKWAVAERICVDENAHLALIDTKEKVEEVSKLKDFNVYVWIGISRQDAEYPWESTNNYIVQPELPWAPEKPEGSHNCLALRGCNRGLTNEDCSHELGFVCEISLANDNTPEIGGN